MSLTDTPDKRAKLALAMTLWHYMRYPERYTINRSICTYYSPKGERCAIGRMVSEREARKLMGPVSGLVTGTLPTYMGVYAANDLVKIQMAHDNIAMTFTRAGEGRTHQYRLRPIQTYVEQLNINELEKQYLLFVGKLEEHYRAACERISAGLAQLI